MKKLLFLLSGIAFLLSSCSSDDSGNGVNPSDILPVKIIQTFEDDGTSNTATVQYEGNKIIKVVYEPGTTVVNYTYSGNLITKIEHFTNQVLEQEEEYQYDDNSRLTRYKRFEEDENYGSEVRYDYNMDGTVSFIQFSGPLSSPLIPTAVGTFDFNSSGEIIAVNHEGGYWESYTYDAKNSPFKNILGFDKLILTGNTPTGYRHNFTEEKNPHSITTTTYTYNANDYPLTAVEDDGYGISTRQFFYNN